MALGGAYAGIQGVKSVMNLSDDMAQTTSRLSMIVDDGGSVGELESQIFASAQRSRASYQDTADVVAKLSLNAGDAFSSNAETIQFAENLNKLFVIAGASQAEVQSASLQLTQALGSGVLRGEELNAVFEAAQFIQQYQEIKYIMSTENPEIQLMVDETEVIKNNQFILTCDEIGITRFEKLLNILVNKNDSLDVRIKRVLVKWNDNIPYTYEN